MITQKRKEELAEIIESRLDEYLNNYYNFDDMMEDEELTDEEFNELSNMLYITVVVRK